LTHRDGLIYFIPQKGSSYQFNYQLIFNINLEVPMKRNVLILRTLLALSCLCLALPALSGAATHNTWRFILPSDAPYDSCTVVFRVKTDSTSDDYQKAFTVAKGNSASWESAKPLSYVFGWCGDGAWRMLPRTCSGTDTNNGSTLTSASCNGNVTVRFCAKRPNPNPTYSLDYGFCSE